MPLKTKVKVGHVNNLSEARYCAGMGVDLLGFPVGENRLRPEQYKEMIEWVSGPEFVLEVPGDREPDHKYITENFKGHYIRIGKNHLSWLVDASLKFIVQLNASDWDEVSAKLAGRRNISFIELNLDTVNDELILVIMKHFPVLIEVTDPEDVDELLELPVAGLALRGSDELRPGLKEYNLASILEALEVD